MQLSPPMSILNSIKKGMISDLKGETDFYQKTYRSLYDRSL